MNLHVFLEGKLLNLLFIGIGTLLVGTVLLFADVSLKLLGLLGGMIAFLVIVWLGVSFWLEKRKFEKLEHLIAELPDGYLLGEVLPAPTNPMERRYFEIIKTVSRSAIGVAEQALQEKEEYCDYVESWIHEIKTPLTACSLILANHGDLQKLKTELKWADNLTKNILYYARLRTAQKDTQIKKFSMKKIIEETVKNQMEILIAARISVDVIGDFQVYSDDKAVSFILQQLFVNAAKYCPGCHIKVIAENGRIVVEDNGIGIPAHEVRRVTERGFTGTNGRLFRSSTGMGLYIVKQLCDRLEITMKIESKVEEFTRIILTFNSLTKL